MVKKPIRYLNTDLELVSERNLTSLVAILEERELCKLHCAQYDNRWYATLEVSSQHDQPETTIARMLTVIESLDDSSRALWDGCTKREFDIGYECGQGAEQLKQTLTKQTLERITAVDASLCITLYPTH